MKSETTLLHDFTELNLSTEYTRAAITLSNLQQHTVLMDAMQKQIEVHRENLDAISSCDMDKTLSTTTMFNYLDEALSDPALYESSITAYA